VVNLCPALWSGVDQVFKLTLPLRCLFLLPERILPALLNPADDAGVSR
jgi:hypothetical protein